jgi:hypothetical protein
MKHAAKDETPREAKNKAWIISVDMGYGHQRAAYPLKDIAYERMITANNDKIISLREHRLWEQSREFYEFVSRLKSIPFIGKITFGIYDSFQQISPFFPFRDLSKPNLSVLRLKALIKRGLCQSIVEYTSKKDIPVITTHFIPALAYNYNKKHVYCIVTDTDINRIWVPDNPKDSTIMYIAPCRHVVERLKEYGVKEEQIADLGFPLPKENIGKNRDILKKDLMSRLVNLDPEKTFFQKYRLIVKDKINKSVNIDKLDKWKNHILTITFTIGGAGAQSDIGLRIMKSLRQKILDGTARLNIAVGTKLDLKMEFEKYAADLGLKEQMGRGFNIIFALDKKTYFETFNYALRTTDVLWTKPSEMSFYTALGIPIIIAPPIGAHEHYNKTWLEHIGSGFVQENPDYIHEWLFYWLKDGRIADAALQGFIDANNMGTYNIESYIFNDKFKNK